MNWRDFPAAQAAMISATANTNRIVSAGEAVAGGKASEERTAHGIEPNAEENTVQETLWVWPIRRCTSGV
jgi:hypothetical protein